MKPLGLLLDLEGVLYQDGAPISGASETLSYLQKAGIQVRYLTNTTTRSQRLIAERLSDFGLAVSVKDVFSPAIAARRYLESESLTSIFLAAQTDLLEDFSRFSLDDKSPDAVIMGDLHTQFDWSLLDRVFAMVQTGAQFIALHKNRYCRRDGRLSLDLGPFVAAIEYATGIKAVIMGKPDGGFFRMALHDMGLNAAETMMVGDDPYADIGGAKDAGIMAVQVRTGKYKPLAPSEAPEADAVINSIADLPALIGT